jgi:hypothetical protein
MLEKTEGVIKNGQSRETGNIGHIGHKAKTNTTKIQHMRWTPLYGSQISRISVKATLTAKSSN